MQAYVFQFFVSKLCLGGRIRIKITLNYSQLQRPTGGRSVAEKWSLQAEDIVRFVCSPWEADAFLRTLNTFNGFWGNISPFWTQVMCFHVTTSLAASVMRVCQLRHRDVSYFLLGLRCDRTPFGVLSPALCGAARRNIYCCGRGVFSLDFSTAHGNS